MKQFVHPTGLTQRSPRKLTLVYMMWKGHIKGRLPTGLDRLDLFSFLPGGGSDFRVSLF